MNSGESPFIEAATGLRHGVCIGHIRLKRTKRKRAVEDDPSLHPEAARL
jgi:hypothetical protein